MLNALVTWYAERTTAELAWIAIGFFAQALFMGRFLVQWIASERARRSIVPEVFWYFSIAGGVLLLAYSIHRADPVFMFGQGLGLLIYLRNIYFIWIHKKQGDSGAAEA